MDFWRMVLQHNVRVIVQVTQFREGNTVTKALSGTPIEKFKSFESFYRLNVMSISHTVCVVSA